MRSWMKKKYFTLLLQSSVVLAVFIGCSSTRNHTFSALNNQENTDPNLPVVYSIKTINDVSSVGFEWPKIADTYDIDGFILYRLKKDSKLKKSPRLKTLMRPTIMMRG